MKDSYGFYADPLPLMAEPLIPRRSEGPTAHDVRGKAAGSVAELAVGPPKTWGELYHQWWPYLSTPATLGLVDDCKAAGVTPGQLHQELLSAWSVAANPELRQIAHNPAKAVLERVRTGRWPIAMPVEGA